MLELVMHSIFLVLGLITVGCVLLITVYLVISGIPAIRRIGLVPFLFNKTWASTAATPSFGILPFILTSIYGTAGAILLGVPVGFFTAVYLAKMAKPSVRAIMQSAVSMLIRHSLRWLRPLVGIADTFVPGIRRLFNVPDGSSLLAAIIVLSIMILPSIIKVSVTALEAVPKEYEDASLALGATPVETYFRVSVPAAKSGIAAAVLGVGRAIGEAMAVMMVSGNVPNMPSFPERKVSDNGRCKRNVVLQRLAASNRPCSPYSTGAFSVHYADKRRAQFLSQKGKGRLDHGRKNVMVKRRAGP